MRRIQRPCTDAVLIFDGDCGFCTSAVALMNRRLPAPPPAVPYQQADLPSLGLTTAEASERVWLVTSHGRYGGHLAVSRMMCHQPNVFMRFLGWLMAAPPFAPLSSLTYRLIADNRYRLPGGTPACALRPPIDPP